MSKTNFAMFVLGAGIGAVATWYCVKNKYEQIAQDEIDSVKEMYRNKNDKACNEEGNGGDKSVTPEEVAEYEETIQQLGYAGNDKRSSNSDEANRPVEPYMIGIDEFGENEDYETVCLYYYKDGVLADADDEKIDNPEAIIGSEALTYLKDCDEDCVYVRNDRLELDYEVAKDLRSYAEATKPRHREG